MNIRNKILLGVVCSVMTLSINVGQSFAALTCETAVITQVGAHPWDSDIVSNYKIRATCDDTNVWSDEREYYFVKDGTEDSFYATALTAMSLKQKVKLQLRGSGVSGSLVNYITLLPTSN